ncbi:hypothetical protein [Kordiimonas gwangyangensis]|uniref:hypothetical protein n=1 Tax=Kordiimonas gwangyangensis TaxID=288022 RepID=UPI00036E3BAD|nr:hypothetical protein [Kordiimonas gwangyangensis]
MQQFGKMITTLALAASMLAVPGAAHAAAAAAKSKQAQPVELRNGESIGDVSMPAGALIDTKKSVILGNGANAFGKIYVKVKADQMKVAEFFKNNMPNEGWGLISEAQDDDIMLTFQKPTRVATIRIERGSSVKLTVVVTPRN